MLDQGTILEIALRGGAAGVNLLIAGLILISRAPRTRRLLGALFVWGTAVYILVSAEKEIEILGPLAGYLKVFAIFNAVFFWWFALSLFDDAFRWTWPKLAPFAAVAALHSFWPLTEPVEQTLHSAISIGLMAHAVWIALHDRADDLVGSRRRFRLYFALAVGVSGAVIAIGEVIEVFFGLPARLTLAHAAALAGLTFYFAFWMLSPNHALFGSEGPAAGRKLKTPGGRQALAADIPALEKLMSLMEEGVYREEGLTVARLAEKVGVPEHQLRRLINRELGFRNFSSFLNERRIEDAKAALCDPANARKQVLQIALELGYGSIAPFNRAFKQAVGKTPSQYRKEMLGEV